MVIPLIQQNRWLSARKPEDLETDGGDNCEKAAVKFADVQQTSDKMTDAALREILGSESSLSTAEHWIYTVGHKKGCHSVFDYNSGNSGAIFMLFVTVETGMNTLHLTDLMA